MYRTKLVVSGMYCGHCVMQLEGALSEIGAEEIQIDQSSGKTTFLSEAKPEVSAVVNAVTKYGFQPHALIMEALRQD